MASEMYQSLEKFLLFQKLYPSKKDDPSFVEVAEALKKDDILLSNDSFDATRLEPGALQSIYLQTLKDEAKTQPTGDQNDRTSQNPRKRTLSSLSLETLGEAAKYSYLLPELVNRLYFNYQREAIEAIRKEEFQYHSLLSKDAEKDKKAAEDRQENSDSTLRSASHGVPSIQTLLRHEEEKATLENKGRQASYPSVSPFQDHSQSLTNGAPSTASSAAHEIRMPSNDPRYNQPSGPPHLPPPQYQAPPYSLPPPGQDAHRRRSSQPLPSPSPRMNQVSLPTTERSSASPIILPPVSGMLRSQGTPAGPLEPVNEAGQLYRSSANMSPRLGQPGLVRPHSNQVPANRNYSQPNYPYHDGRQYPGYLQYGQQGYYAQYAGPASNIPQGSPYATSPNYPPPGPTQPPQHPGYYPSQGYYAQSPMPASYLHQQPPRYPGHQTPTPDASRQPLALASVNSSTSSTKWKKFHVETAMKPPGSPTRPLSREISPISNRDESPETDATPIRGYSSKAGREGENTADVKPASARGRRGRGSSRAGRAGALSGSVRGVTRSQSVTSPADELSNGTNTSAARKVKPEPSTASLYDEETSTMDESSRKPGRRRRGTLREDEPSAIPRSAIKRKRTDSNLPLPSPLLDQPPRDLPPNPEIKVVRKPGYVLATRNLSKISSSLMQTIIAHKDAYLFMKPLTERDAPGYDELIFRPQDFKAVKAALVAGSKAVAAAVDGAKDEIDHGSKCVWVSETEEFVPPKGIVNPIQLEKELLRIFANAVMFNPDLDENRGLGVTFHARARTLENHQAGADEDIDGEAARSEIGVAKPVDGAVVNDTRKMCAEIEEAFDAWKDIGRVDDAEAREAPVLGYSKDDSEEKSNNKESPGKRVDGEEVGTIEDEEEKKEASEEPRPKRRRRQR